MKKILILTGRYLPGYKDGGPVRTLKNLTDSIGERYKFTICCADRDHGDVKAYDNIKVNEINTVGNTDVFYVKDGKFSFSIIKKLANESDIIYVCGPYNSYAIKALILNRLGIIKKPFVLAPMGSFSKGALNIKSTKKKIFLTLFKALAFFKGICFSVTSDVEEKELKEALKIDNKCFIAEDPQRAPDESLTHNLFRRDGRLNVVFLSRICEKKNLLGALNILKNVKGDIAFHVYGTMEDESYYNECLKIASELPSNILFEYKGEVESDKVPFILSKYDVFLFPTFGENFGHVISEALLAGTIPVISNTTPWSDFDEKLCGYVIDLKDTEKFSKTIDELSSMKVDELKKISNNAVRYYQKKYDIASANNGYIKMFEEL